MARTSRAQAAAAARRTPTPEDVSDEEMIDEHQSDQSNAEQDASEDDVENEVDGDEGDDQGTPEIGSCLTTPIPGRAPRARGRRGGRGGRGGRQTRRGSNRRDTADDGGAQASGSEAGTPRKRGGWRGRGFGGGRWGKTRGGPSHVTQVPLDKDGNMANVKNDEIELPLDEEGETKVNENGYLQGGREYRVRTFKIEDKGERLYMLSTEPARCVGFRDSYLFFQKHRLLYKIILAEEAKKDLIERSIIPHSYKGRAIGVVTARSVFREFGARIIIGGKKVTDDYQVQEARTRGEVEGELANPDDRVPGGGEEYDRNKYVAWHGASAVYHTGAPTVPVPIGKGMDGKKRKTIVTGTNWMFEHAREASKFNSSLAFARRYNSNGVYDVHTNVMQYPKIMQPSHARWEQVPPPETEDPDAVAIVNTSIGRSDQDEATNTIFPPIPPIYTRNFMISDTYYTTPASSTLGYPGPDEDVLDIGPKGLNSISADVIAALPEDCRKSFIETRAKEAEWKESWSNERHDGYRARLKITYNV